MVRTAVALLFSALCISLPAGRLAAAERAQAKPPVNPHAQALVEFKKRVDTYLELRRAVTQKYPEVKETGDPAKIHDRVLPGVPEMIRLKDAISWRYEEKERGGQVVITTADPAARSAVHDFLKTHPEFRLEQPAWPFNESALTDNVTHWPQAYLRRTS